MTQHHPTLIGLTGPAGSGKDTVAELLRTHRDAHVMAFADALREEIMNAYYVEHSHLTHHEKKEKPLNALALSRCLENAFVGHMLTFQAQATRNGDICRMIDLDAPRSPRQIMQWWGTEYRRTQHPNYWVEKATQHIRWLITVMNAKLIVIADVRFQNEAELVRSMGGKIWQIKRPASGLGSGAHVSEVTGEAFSPDAVINNSHDIRHLQQLVLGTWASQAWGVPGVRVEIPA